MSPMTAEDGRKGGAGRAKGGEGEGETGDVEWRGVCTVVGATRALASIAGLRARLLDCRTIAMTVGVVSCTEGDGGVREMWEGEGG